MLDIGYGKAQRPDRREDSAMLLKRTPSWHMKESLATDEHIYQVIAASFSKPLA